VHGDREVMFSVLCGGEAEVTSGLAGHSIPKDGSRVGKLAPGYVPGQPHTARISSFT
jgi:hypothetical protein